MKMQGLALLCALLAGCASAPQKAAPPIDPAHAIQLAAMSAPRKVRGVFAVHVQASGTQHGAVYLNTESDYRDPRNLSIAITPFIAEQLAIRFGSPPVEFFKGKDILVTGAAQRVPIWLFEDGIRTNKFYYQTHVRVTDLDQIQLVPAT